MPGRTRASAIATGVHRRDEHPQLGVPTTPVGLANSATFICQVRGRLPLGESVPLVAIGSWVGSQSFSVAQRRTVSRTRSIAADWLWAGHTIDHLSRTSGWTILRATRSGAAWTA